MAHICINKSPSLVPTMAFCLNGTKPSSEPIPAFCLFGPRNNPIKTMEQQYNSVHTRRTPKTPSASLQPFWIASRPISIVSRRISIRSRHISITTRSMGRVLTQTGNHFELPRVAMHLGSRGRLHLHCFCKTHWQSPLSVVVTAVQGDCERVYMPRHFTLPTT